MMDWFTNYEIPRTVEFILNGNFDKVALQFPDVLLKDSTKVASLLRDELRSRNSGSVRFYVMADTTFGSCCVDEVGAAHIGANCVVHYGHTCLSPTTTLPALFIFGKAAVNVNAVVDTLCDILSKGDRNVLVLYGLECENALQNIKETLTTRRSTLSLSSFIVHYADVKCSVMNPSDYQSNHEDLAGFCDATTKPCLKDSSVQINQSSSTSIVSYSLGGLTWNLPEGCKMEECLLFWIGYEDAAFANLVLTFNSCKIVRFDAEKSCLVEDVATQHRILKHRYYLVERAKDANIVGILVGTLGIAGYLSMIHQMKALVREAGKKSYMLVMGRPNPAKLANFPECDVFVYVSCAQTALFNSKEFLAPVITPYEATLAFSRECHWTGAYMVDFRDFLSFPFIKPKEHEGHFSFFEGLTEDQEPKEKDLALAELTNRILTVSGGHSVAGTAMSGAEFFVSRSYRGLTVASGEMMPQAVVTGRTGRASGYVDEKRAY